MTNKRFTSVLCLLFLLVVVGSPSFAVVRVPTDAADITTAMGMAAPGEEIWVANTHVDPANPLTPGPNTTIVSYDPSFTTPTFGASVVRLDIGSGGPVVLDGLFINPPSPLSSLAIFFASAEVTVRNCEITGGGHGFFLLDNGGTIAGSILNIESSTVHDKELDFLNHFSGGGVTVNIQDSIFNTCGGWGFSMNQHETTYNITNTDIINCSGRSFFTDAKGQYNLTNVTFDQTGAPNTEPIFWLGYWSGNKDASLPADHVSSVTITNCTFTAATHTGFLTDSGGSTITMSNTSITDSFFEAIAFWGSADDCLMTLTDVNLLRSGRQGQFGAGIFCDAVANLDFTRVMIADNSSTESDGMFFTANASGSGVTLNNCTITTCGRNGFNTDGCIPFNADHTAPMQVTNCTFNNNGVGVGGSGFSTNIASDGSGYSGLPAPDDFNTAWQFAEGFRVDFTNCSFNNNTADGFLPFRGLTASFVNCDIQGNTFGGFTRIVDLPNTDKGTDITATGCDFRNNGFPGFLISTVTTTIDLTDCTFVDNGLSGSRAQMDLIGGSGTVSQCLFQAPVGTADPNIWCDGFGVDDPMGFSTGIISNCVIDGGTVGISIQNGATSLAFDTIVGSHTTGQNGSGESIEEATGVRFATGTHSISSCIVDGFSVSLWLEPSASFKLEDYNLLNSPVVGFASGSNDITGDPDFRTPSTGTGTGDFHLGNNSVAIAAANTLLNSFFPTDFEGNPRDGVAYDIGAYEYAEPASNVREWALYE